MAKKKAAGGGPSNGTAANLGFEAKLWLTADKLRNNMDAAEYKHVVLSLPVLNGLSVYGLKAEILHRNGG